MIRAALLRCAVAAAVLLALPAAAAFGAVLDAQLRPHVIVDGKTIKLGDVFEHAGKHEDKIIAYTPRPGRKLILDAHWLYRVARAYGVAWRPSSRLDQSVVERRSVIVDATIIANAILAAAQRELHTTDRLDADLDNRTLQVHLPADEPATAQVTSFSHDPVSGRFSALVYAPDTRPGAQRMTVTGRLRQLVDVPVLTSRKSTNEVIRKDDITWVTLHRDQLDRGIVLDDAKLIGMSPRRPVPGQRPIRSGEIQPPVLVEKGSRVTIALRMPFLQLTASGKALENGAMGETIRVQNRRSNKTIDAVVTAQGQVVVTAPIAANMRAARPVTANR